MTKQNNTFISFTQSLEQIMTFFKIKGPTEKWARYFSTVNTLSSERRLIKQAADIFHWSSLKLTYMSYSLIHMPI